MILYYMHTVTLRPVDVCLRCRYRFHNGRRDVVLSLGIIAPALKLYVTYD